MRVINQSSFLPSATVFSGSFLLFMIQPMLGRTLLPVFGGSASVWCVCLASFQTLLLVGYAYAHGVERRGGLRRVHGAVTALAALWVLAVAARRGALLAWLGTGDAHTAAVLAGVILFVGIPYVTLAAGSTLVQAWLAESAAAQAPQPKAHSVYSLYAVSNLGSLLGLLSYPLVLEPFVSLTAQWYGLAIGLSFYALLMGGIIRGSASQRDMPSQAETKRAEPRRGSVVLWFVLPGLSAFLLNATITHLMVDVTPMPLVWAVLLAAFLLSYVVGFSSRVERRRGTWCGGAALALAGAAVASGMWGSGSFFPNAAAGVGVILFVGAVVHGWLYEERPETARLTHYYLAIAAGGAAGGLLAALVAPLVFNRVTEFPLALFVSAALVAWRLPKPAVLARLRWGQRGFAAGCALVWLLLFQATARHTQSTTLFRGRNFYGCLAVTQTYERISQQGVVPVHYLWCGQTTHGIQIHAPDAALRNRATSYFSSTGGGIAFIAHPKYQAGVGMKVGVVGLGAGTLASYGRPGDLFRFYEINPMVEKIAIDPQLFTFLPDAKMPIDLVMGDARRMLEKEQAAGDPLYDVLVIDAYSGDAVPYHLATLEAFRLYFQRLDENGILAVHVSNWHIDLLPLCKSMAVELGVCAYGVVGVSQDSLTSDSIWVFMTRKPIPYRYPGKAKVHEVVWSDVREIAAPTDEKGSLITLIRH